MSFIRILSLAMSFNIIVAFMHSIYYNLLYCKCKHKWLPTEDKWLSVIKCIVGIYFIVLYAYAFYLTLINSAPMDNYSFGVLFVRPGVLIVAVSSAISTRQKLVRYNCGGGKWIAKRQ